MGRIRLQEREEADLGVSDNKRGPTVKFLAAIVPVVFRSGKTGGRAALISIAGLRSLDPFSPAPTRILGATPPRFAVWYRRN
jgi:hypothetical protein